MNPVHDPVDMLTQLHFYYTTIHFRERTRSAICYNTYMRIDRLLANSGYGTRSQIKEWIRSGRVCLNGTPILDPSYSVAEQPSEEITLDGSPVFSTRYLYLCMNKPAECLTALEDKRLPTIADLLPRELLHKGLAAVGRLDYHTTGVLLLTNNGVLCHRLTSPKWHIEKTYLVTYEGDSLDDDVCRMFASGMTLTDYGPEHPEILAPARLVLLTDHTCRLTLTEGKTHQVKRMLAGVSRQVTSLHRENVGGITLENGPETGQYRSLSTSEIHNLFAATHLNGTPL
jgi:16S rRNA pseudouridine516 synthase